MLCASSSGFQAAAMGRAYRRDDRFFREARSRGLRARSAFKIDEIARRFSLLRPGLRALDLGAAPGGFLTVIAEAVGKGGLAVGIDLFPIAPLGRPQVLTAVVDVLAPDASDRIALLAPPPYDLVTSDLAPKTTGIRITDEARSLELARAARGIASRLLRPGGDFVCKVFMGGDLARFEEEVRAGFDSVKIVRPEATRSRSFEAYLVGRGQRPR